MQIDRDQTYKYVLSSHPQYGFFTGLTQRGEQLLGVAYGESLITARFTGDGELIGWDVRLLAYPAKPEGVLSALAIHERSISVRRFSIPLPGEPGHNSPWERNSISIEDVPWHVKDVLLSHGQAEGEEVKEALSLAKEWLDRGDYVFWCGSDYGVNKDGEVVSS
jgi:hypothetical protein